MRLKSHIYEIIMFVIDTIFDQNTLENVKKLGDYLPGGFVVVKANEKHEIIYANKKACNIFGCHCLEELVSLTSLDLEEMIYPEDREAYFELLSKCTFSNSDEIHSISFRFIRNDGALRWFEDFITLHQSTLCMEGVYCIFFTDITEKKMEARHELKKVVNENEVLSTLAYQDGLTGVKNSNALKPIVDRINKQIKEGKAEFAVVMCDVDNLKTINDIHGHIAGDKAIKGACTALKRTFRKSEIFRMGGDEFVAILEGDDFKRRNMLMKSIERSRFTDKKMMHHFSIGIATFEPMFDHCYIDVYARADAAMYRMKKKSKNIRISRPRKTNKKK